MLELPEVRLRLSIWRPASLDRTYLYNDDARRGPCSILHESALLEQIYRWDTGRHDIYGSCNDVAAELIRDRLARPFSRHAAAPATRSVRRFQAVVTELIDCPDVRGGTSWFDSPETVTTGSGELSLRANVALGVLRHFRWVARVFADVPDASVLLR